MNARRLALTVCIVVLVAVAANIPARLSSVQAGSVVHALAAKKVCRTVTKKRNGKKIKVRVCHAVKPSPTATVTATSTLTATATATSTPTATLGPPQWTVTGDASPSLRAIDDRVQRFMEQYSVRAGSLTILKAGTIVFQHAYTWAPPGYPTTQPLSLFRVASNSKAFTSAAIYQLFSSGHLSPSQAIFPLLGITSPALSSQTPSPNINDITIQELLDHAGGWNDHLDVTAKDGTHIPGTNWDPVFGLRQISQALQLDGPPSKRDMARYMYGEPLQFVPGTQNFDSTNGASYSNFGYVLLGLAVEKVTGMSFADYVRQKVLAPIGISDVYLAHTNAAERLPNEVTYDDPATGPSVFYPKDSVQAPYPYGGGGFMTETMDSGGGLAMTSAALATFVHNYAVFGVGPRPTWGGTWWLGRSGSMPGTISLAVSRSRDIDYAYIFNSRSFPATAGFEDLYHDIDAAIDSTFP